MPQILSRVNAKFVIVGSGYMRDQLLNMVRSMGVENKILFEGFLDEPSLLKVQKIADVSVVPSLFEPFGIVALEAMAAKSAAVVSDTGGLSEIVQHDYTGVKSYPNNPDSLAWAINRVLLDDGYRRWIVDNAYRVVQEKYGWDKIAKQTKRTYEVVMGEFHKSGWS
jgi:glycogen synthase